MKYLRNLLCLVSLLASAAFGQVSNVQVASGSNPDVTKPLTGFNFPSGFTLNVKSGATVSGAGTFDFSSSLLKIPNGASPTTATFGSLAAANAAWAASRGALQTFDGTAITYLVGTLASSTPANGNVPIWNTGGTITWGGISATPGGATTQVQYNLAGVFTGSANFTYASSALTLVNTLAANTSGDGEVLSNTGTASAANQMYSPRLRLTGAGWKTNATAASQVVDWVSENRPIQGAAAPTTQLAFASQIAGGGYTDKLVLDSGGNIYFGPSATAAFASSTSGALTLTAAGSNQNINLAPSGTGIVSVSTSGAGGININQTGASQPYLQIQIAGSTYALIGSDNGGGNIITGANNKALCIRPTTSSIDFSSDNGTSVAGRFVWSTGQFTLLKGIASTTTGTGTLVVTGGVGVSGDQFGGGKIVTVSPTAGLGYATGAGGAIAQITSRTTGVTISKVCGAITLVSAAGTATAQSFTVTNTTVAANDTIVVNQQSGTDLYEIFVTNVAAGSFRITYFTTGGTTTETPVFNFSVIKAVNS
jgi:hypothetical protein